MPKQISADIISKDIKKRIDELTTSVVNLNKEIDKLEDTVIKGQRAFENNAKSQGDLKKRTETLTAEEKEAIKVQNSLNKVKKESKDITYEEILAKEKKRLATKKMTEEARKELGVQKENISFTDKMTKSLKAGIVQLGIMVGAVAGAVRGLASFGKSIIDSSDVLQDQWTEAMSMAKAAYDTFIKALSSNNGFKDFWSNVGESMRVARDYARVMDDLEKSNFANQIEEAKYADQLAKDIKIYRSAKSTIDEKTDALNDYMKIKQMIATHQETNATKAYDKEIDNLIKGTKLTREQAKAYVEEYNNLDPLTKKALEYIDIQKSLATASGNPIKQFTGTLNTALSLISGATKQDVAHLKELQEELLNAGDAGKEAAKKAIQFADLSPELWKKAAASAEKFYQTKSKFNEETVRASLIGDRIELESARNTAKEIVDEREKGNEYELLQRKEANLILNDLDKGLKQSYVDNTKKYTDEELLIIAETERLKAELKEASFDAVEKIVSDQINATIDGELNAYKEAAKAKEDILKNQLDKGIITEAQYQKKVKAIQLKVRQEEAKAEKKKALFSIGISTAEALIKQLAVIPLPAGAPLLALVAALGAIQAAAVIAQPLPKFRYGTQNAPGGAAVVSEGGSELGILPSGQKFLTPENESVLNLPKGTKIFPAYSKETKEAKEDYIGTMAIVNELQLTRKAISGQTRKTTTINQRGLESFVQHNNMRIKMLNERFR